jgi:dolichol kinase
VKAGQLRPLLHATTAFLLLTLLQSWQALRAALVMVGLLAVVFEALRLSRPGVRDLAARWVPVFRPQEARRPSGAAWLFVGYALAAWMPAPAPVAAVLAGALADPAAALMGGRFGRGRPKSWPGSAAALAIAVLALWLAGIPPLAAAAGGLAAAALERWSGPVNDNLVVAPGVGLVVWWLA